MPEQTTDHKQYRKAERLKAPLENICDLLKLAEVNWERQLALLVIVGKSLVRLVIALK